MTSQVNTIGSPSGPLYEYHSKDGDDGKYEVVNGIHRVKWNAFQSIHIHQDASPDLDFGMYYMSALNYGPEFLKMFEGNLFKCQSRLVDRINLSSFNLGVSVATGKQTVDLIVDTMKTLTRAAHFAKHGDFLSSLKVLGVGPKGGKRRFKTTDLSSRWLELQYGWLPLLSDCSDAAVAFSKLSEVRVLRFTASSKMTANWNSSQNVNYWTGSGPARYRTKIIAELSEDVSVQRNLGLLDPLSVVWEVMPWSFVIDWFLPIGDYLNNLNIIPFLNGRFMTITTWQHGQETTSVEGVFGYRGCVTHSRRKQTSRSVSTSLTTARPRFQSLPSAMSPRRIYNAVALFHQKFP
jgi:hypothetical protein